MFRGRPPRGGYGPPFEGRGPPPPRPFNVTGYRDDRSRPVRPAYHPGHHDHGPPDSYHRSPPRRRYPSPGSGSHPSGEYWAAGAPRERSPSPRGSGPLDHNLVITVGNELTGSSGPAPSRLHDRDYPPRPEYERSRSRGRSRPRSHSRERSLDRSRAKSQGRSKSQVRSKSRPRSQSRSPDRSRARSRAKSRGRSRSRSQDRSRAKSRGRSRSRSQDRSRAKSRGRSRSRSQDRSRAKSRGRSKSRHHSRSRSRSRSRGRSYSRAASRSRRYRSRSSSSSSSSSSRSSGKNSRKEFEELETARRRKELEEMLTLPTKSILKKRNDSDDSPSLRSGEGVEGSSMSHVADQLLQAVKGMEPHMVASMLSELRSDPQMARRAGLDAEIKEILHLLGGQASESMAQEPPVDDMDDEEKFLYGDTEEPKPQPSSEPVRHHGLDLYGDVTEEALYGDYPPPVTVSSQMYSVPQVASPHLSAPTIGGEVDVRYTSRPSITPEQNFTVHVSNPSLPPGTEPLEESERQAVEEYEKIQDLLKTIGLDLGVSEISKMAARTKERLHGNKPPPPKTPTRRRYSSGSSDGSRRSRGRRRRSHSSSSSSSSSSRSHSREQGRRTGSWSSDDTHRKSAPQPKSHKDKDLKETKAEHGDAVPPQQLPQAVDPNTITAHPGAPIPPYPPPQVRSMIPPNYPPPGYGQYGNYLPYMHQQWPPMYPPPMTMPRQNSMDEFTPTQPYNYPPSEPGVKALGKNSVQDMEKGSAKVSSHNKRVSEEQNNESQKLKVMEEREKLKHDREVRMKKKEYLMKELERLRKQQGELLRKKRREKDGHKDPLLQEIGRLQEEVMSQISNLRKEHEAAEKKRSEIEKVALILGLNPSDRPRRTSKQAADQEDQQPQPTPPEKKKRVAERSPEGRPAASSSSVKQTSVGQPSNQSLEKLAASAPPVPVPVPAPAPATAPLPAPPEPFEYYDAGNHWCKNCNVTSGSMFDFFTHLHSKLHRKTLDPYERPWASTPTKISKNTPSEEKLTKPAKGSEFLLPVRGFFCLLCKEFFGDAICAEEHVTTHNHNEKYKKQMYENPMYEQRRNLDRQAGLTSETSGKKRKHEDNEKGSKDKEEKSKHKKEKKDKERKRGDDDEDKVKVKEERGEKSKQSKREDEYDDVKSHDEGRPIYCKKDGRKDDKYRYNREEEDTGKYRREEEERYRYSREEEPRYRYRRDGDDRYDERSKYGSRDDEDRYKSSKYPDLKSKYDREREDEKPNTDRQAFKKPELERPAAKPEASKPEPPSKPYDLPKVFCGPSPAMRAKLRKQSLEAGKPATVAATTSFGSFTWKKKENVLAKEAQKAAAEFIKDDEEGSIGKPVSAEDSFAKSMAVAKEIAQKLGGTQNMPPPPWVSNLNNRGRGRGRGIRPNLPAPAAVMRKTAMMGKPAPLNTFLSIRPQSTSTLGSPPKDLPSLQEVAALNIPVPFQGPQSLYDARAQAAQSKPPPPKFSPNPLKAKTDQPVSGSAPSENKTTPTSSTPEKFQVKPQELNLNPAPPVSKPAESDRKHMLSDSKPLPVKTTSAPSCATTSAPPVVRPPQPSMIKIVPDVAAPGVPESEQTHTVFVQPPPFMKMGEAAQKSEKHRSNLAAAKAQDLFDIFYSGIGHSSSSSITKTSTDTRADRSGTNKSELPVPQAQNTQPQQQLVTQNQLPAVVCKTQQPGTNKAPPSPKTQPETDKNPPGSQTKPETDKNPPGSQTKPETDKNPPGSQTKPETDKNPPGSQNKPETDKNPPGSQTKAETDKNPPGSQTQPETDKNPPGSQTQPETDNNPPSSQTQSESEIQISSVWSMQSSPAEVAPFGGTSRTNQPILDPPDFSKSQGAPENQSSTSKSASQTNTELEPITQGQFQHKQAPLPKTDPQSEPNQDTEPQSQSDLDTAPVPDSKRGRKTRGKTTPTKKTCPAPRPVRQTRSQTRYQTRNLQHQSQSETEPDLASGDSDSAASDSKGLDTSDPGSGLQSMEETTSEGDSQAMEITPETLGLPSDMTSLDFEYDFNFE